MHSTQRSELVKLLELKALSPFERRKRRLRAAEARVFGRDERGEVKLDGLGSLMQKANHGHLASLSADELLIVNLGCTQEEVRAYYQEQRVKERT